MSVSYKVFILWIITVLNERKSFHMLHIFNFLNIKYNEDEMRWNGIERRQN